jgi:hypothetical protein
VRNYQATRFHQVVAALDVLWEWDTEHWDTTTEKPNNIAGEILSVVDQVLGWTVKTIVLRVRRRVPIDIDLQFVFVGWDPGYSGVQRLCLCNLIFIVAA